MKIYSLLLALVATASLHAATTIKMAVRHGELRFDKESFTVKPGEKVKLSFYNNDEMQHNVVICKRGTDTNAIGMAAVALGAEGMAKQFIPESDKLLWYTPLVEPGDTYVLEFTAPKEPGFYPYVCTFPGHFNLMKGVMTVGKVSPLSELTWQKYDGTWKKLPDFSKLKPTKTGKLGNKLITAQPHGKQAAEYGLVFTGKLTSPDAGTYEFQLAGDDGIRLLIDGKKIVEHDGQHAMETKVGKAKLKAGVHDFRLEYFQGGGGLGIALAMSGPGLPPVVLSKTPPPKSGQKPKSDLVIPVTDRIEIYRTGLNHDGKHAFAVCVGFPGGINCAFDADDCALIAVWQGDFVDPKSDWTGRGGNGSSIAGDLLATFAADSRPVTDGQSPKPVFDGYRVHPDKVEFRFTIGSEEIVQTLSPVPGGIAATTTAKSGKPAAITWPQPLTGTLSTLPAADGMIRFEVKK